MCSVGVLTRPLVEMITARIYASSYDCQWRCLFMSMGAVGADAARRHMPKKRQILGFFRVDIPVKGTPTKNDGTPSLGRSRFEADKAQLAQQAVVLHSSTQASPLPWH